MKFKAERIKTLIKQEILNLIASGTIGDKRIPQFLTITKLTLSKDLHYAHVYFTFSGTDQKVKDAEKGLNSAAGYFQRQIAGNLNLRFTPKLEFRFDVNEVKAHLVEDLLNSISNQEPDQPEE